MYEQSLTQTGLSAEMAQIYELLLKNGAQTAGKLAKKSGLKRGLTYKTLERLLEKQLIDKSEENEKVAVFTATHPLKLQDMIESRQQRAKNAQLALDGVLGVLISDYNLGLGKPGLNVYQNGQVVHKEESSWLPQNNYTTKNSSTFFSKSSGLSKIAKGFLFSKVSLS